MLIPIRTQTDVRHTPAVNIALIAANVAIFVLFGGASKRNFLLENWIFNPLWPQMHQYITYQFLHGDIMHLLGNMIFLYVFGNAVSAKMGDLPYLLFYLSCGMLSALGFALSNNNPMLGASGSIAGVTTAYLVLFPRSRVTVLYFFFLIGTFELPAIWIIGLKIILWDNIISPSIGPASNVAHGAHLAGYAVGFLFALLMLAFRALPRDHFDMLSLVKRWKQRREYASAMADPEARSRAEFGRVARVQSVSPEQQAIENQRLDALYDLRTRISECANRGEIGPASSLYEQLIAKDANQCMPERVQLMLAREFYGTGRMPQAASAFELYLKRYPGRPDESEVKLLLGIILARDLRLFETAEPYLESAVQKSLNPTRKNQAINWLNDVRAALGKPPWQDE